MSTSYYGQIYDGGDALLVIEACRLGLLPETGKRLSSEEQHSVISSGAVFCWSEDDPNHVKRWTDGRKWAPSRVDGPFLLYIQKYRLKGNIGGENGVEDLQSRMIKKTITVSLKNGQKFHLVAYFEMRDLPHLPSPSSDSLFKDLVIDKDLYPELPNNPAEPRFSGKIKRVRTIPAPIQSSAPYPTVSSYPSLVAPLSVHLTPKLLPTPLTSQVQSPSLQSALPHFKELPPLRISTPATTLLPSLPPIYIPVTRVDSPKQHIESLFSVQLPQRGEGLMPVSNVGNSSYYPSYSFHSF